MAFARDRAIVRALLALSVSVVVSVPIGPALALERPGDGGFTGRSSTELMTLLNKLIARLDALSGRLTTADVGCLPRCGSRRTLWMADWRGWPVWVRWSRTRGRQGGDREGGVMRRGALMVGVVAGVCATALVAGCSESDGAGPTASPSASESSASPSPSESASPSATASPSPTETSDIPAAARKQTPAGAEAFLAYYVERANASWTEPNDQILGPISTTKCEFCNGINETATYLVEHDERYRSDPIAIRKVEAFGGAPSGDQYLSFEFIQNAVDVVGRDGQVKRSDPSVVGRSYARLRWSAGGWKLFGIERAE